MPYCRAVADIRRGARKLSSTILSFSSSDQRRRRPVSTTSSRSTGHALMAVHKQVLTTKAHPTRRPRPEGNDKLLDHYDFNAFNGRQG